ncbi:Retrovirus-related Pol polyprotein from type-1 retrotransposable element R1 4 [Eumeta japonica]|uniref:Retrovirus-related Pol polyprotein from type-1 retrotransposable element R1 4 n=1 Tax=Eumeta variegata TaxID=151549 RepID=A0A4C1X4W6_EUMVA|nr:Retrovirus-related Pol polyprotein from type-1 retrotransposable element R1 4 [Eumeta japonica]
MNDHRAEQHSGGGGGGGGVNRQIYAARVSRHLRCVRQCVVGNLLRPATVRMDGGSIQNVTAATVLGVVLDERLSFVQHAQSISKRVSKSVGKVSRVSAASALLRTQIPALILLTNAYKTTNMAALPVLAGMLPADLEVTSAGRVDKERDARVSSPWVEPDYETSQLLTGHGYFRKRLYELGLNESSVCLCEQTDEDMHHVLWSCPLYDEIRKMLKKIKVMCVAPVYYADLTGSRAN